MNAHLIHFGGALRASTQKATFVAAGGLPLDTVGEDMELDRQTSNRDAYRGGSAKSLPN